MRSPEANGEVDESGFECFQRNKVRDLLENERSVFFFFSIELDTGTKKPKIIIIITSIQ
jgi:hypothetical protein